MNIFLQILKKRTIAFKYIGTIFIMFYYQKKSIGNQSST